MGCKHGAQCEHGARLCPAPAQPTCCNNRQAAVTEEHTLQSLWLALDTPDVAGQQADQQYLAHGLPKLERNHREVLGIYELSAPQQERKREGRMEASELVKSMPASTAPARGQTNMGKESGV